jgi:hypothetical protein
MTKRLILLIVLLCGVQGALAQGCGSTRSTDLDGSYVSSSSPDQCSGGGYIYPVAEYLVLPLQASPNALRLQSSGSTQSKSIWGEQPTRLPITKELKRFFDPNFVGDAIIPNTTDSTPALTEIDKILLLHKLHNYSTAMLDQLILAALPIKHTVLPEDLPDSGRGYMSNSSQRRGCA